ncbi:NAD-binding protein [Oscillospiraceae bacterium LTW-04]|nr:NAD-binding protein [Oscillospiraceae bacterium MB24-C1]
MTALLVFAALGTFLLGYFIMYRLDLFFENENFLDGAKGRANQGVLVYGAPDVVEKMKKSGIKCKALLTSSFPEDDFYSALFALSGDDSKNLAICHAAKRADPGIYIIARCNAPDLCKIFEDTGAERLLNAGESVDALLGEMRGIGR